MKRRALIIYCDDTDSGKLEGPLWDNSNYRAFLQSNLGGDWREGEILSLRNPSSAGVAYTVTNFLNGADYTFIIFSGHGYIDLDDNRRQYIELSDKSVSILKLRTTARRQTLVVDACRGYHSRTREITRSLSESFEKAIGDVRSTRQLFDNFVLKAEEGWTILYAADENQTALDTDNGGAYLLSLLRVAEEWDDNDQINNKLGLKNAHRSAKEYLLNNFDTIQVPVMNGEKRTKYFPFAVKF